MSQDAAQRDDDREARIAALEAELFSLREAKDKAEHERSERIR